jgi:hypothetical protein
MTSFSDFIATRQCSGSPRGKLVGLLQTWRNSGMGPPIFEWRDLYFCLLRRHDTTDETILEARKLWFDFKANQK